MTATKSVSPKKKSQPQLTDDEQRELLEQSRERLAESQLDMAKLFIEKEKPKIALRRLKEIVAEFSGSAAATEAKSLMKNCRGTLM